MIKGKLVNIRVVLERHLDNFARCHSITIFEFLIIKLVSKVILGTSANRGY
jgi:hypothetical protein